EFGNWSTVYGRHRRWSLDGTWAKIGEALRAGCDAAEGADWTVSADSTVVRAHQHAAGARHAVRGELARGGAAGGPETARRAWPGGFGPVPGRADHQDSPGLRPAVPPCHRYPHPRPARRLSAVHPADEPGPHRPERHRAAPHPAGPGDGRQGVLLR